MGAEAARGSTAAAVSGERVRQRLLRVLRRSPHRYDRLRALSQGAGIAILFAIPAAGIARIDVWGGRHAALIGPVSLREGLAAVLVAIAALYVVTFLSNVVLGRMFCGWGCPVGQIHRFADLAFDRASASRRRSAVAGLAFALAFVVSMFSWWADPAVLWRGSPAAAGIAWAVVGSAVVLAALHARFVRWSFCRMACPIGLYYSFVSPAKGFGVSYPHPESCIECDACDRVCPVALAPRDLAAPVGPRGGLAVTGAPGRNHCLECGDCVRACEHMVAKRPVPVPLRLGFHGRAGHVGSVHLAGTRAAGSAAGSLPGRAAGSAAGFLPGRAAAARR